MIYTIQILPPGLAFNMPEIDYNQLQVGDMLYFSTEQLSNATMTCMFGRCYYRVPLTQDAIRFMAVCSFRVEKIYHDFEIGKTKVQVQNTWSSLNNAIDSIEEAKVELIADQALQRVNYHIDCFAECREAELDAQLDGFEQWLECVGEDLRLKFSNEWIVKFRRGLIDLMNTTKDKTLSLQGFNNSVDRFKNGGILNEGKEYIVQPNAIRK